LRAKNKFQVNAHLKVIRTANSNNKKNLADKQARLLEQPNIHQTNDFGRKIQRQNEQQETTHPPSKRIDEFPQNLKGILQISVTKRHVCRVLNVHQTRRPTRQRAISEQKITRTSTQKNTGTPVQQLLTISPKVKQALCRPKIRESLT
jgi:hypothetical protein